MTGSIRQQALELHPHMVRALLNGHKTVHREPIKPSTPTCRQFPHVGDHLWVREPHFIKDYRGGSVPEAERPKCEVLYQADCKPVWKNPEGVDRWRSSTIMPRWASRIVLLITNVRTEALQDISHEQAVAEGILAVAQNAQSTRQFWRDYRLSGDGSSCVPSAQESFSTLWNQTNETQGWQENPWVWVIDFEVVEIRGVPTPPPKTLHVINQRSADMHEELRS